MLVEFVVPHGVAFDGMLVILMWLWGSLHFVPRILSFLGITSFGRSGALLFQHSGEFHHVVANAFLIMGLCALLGGGVIR
jgi:hypothetical protein